MVLPLSAANEAPESVPDTIVAKHAYCWWFLWVLLMAVCIGRIVGLDALGALNSGLCAYFIYAMVKDRCQKMTQYCLVLFGFLCFVNGLLETISLVGNLGGRMTEVQTNDKSTGNTATFTVTIQKHPFFDHSQGWMYNLQSWLMIASPVVSLIACIMSYWSYHAFPTSFFQDGEDESFGGMYGVGGPGSLYGGHGAVSGAQQPPGPDTIQGGGRRFVGGGSQGLPSSQGVRMFEGHGQRLSS